MSSRNVSKELEVATKTRDFWYEKNLGKGTEKPLNFGGCKKVKEHWNHTADFGEHFHVGDVSF